MRELFPTIYNNSNVFATVPYSGNCNDVFIAKMSQLQLKHLCKCNDCRRLKGAKSLSHLSMAHDRVSSMVFFKLRFARSIFMG